MSARRRGATGSSTTDRKICSTDSGGACSRSRSAAATAALNDHRNLARVHLNCCPYARARGARRFQRAVRPSCAEQTDRLEPAVRLLATLPFHILVDIRFGATMEVGRSGRAPARATGSSTTDRKICSTDSGGACSRSRSAAATAALNDHRNLARVHLNCCPYARARGARRFQRAVRPSCAEQTDRLEPAVRLLATLPIPI